MKSAHSRFSANLGRARDLRSLVLVIGSSTVSALDLSDVLRACIVGGVSAFDALVHEIVRVGMLEIVRGVRPRTEAFGRFAVSMNSVSSAMSDPANLVWLESEIRKQHGWLSFQHPDKVAEAVRLFCGKELWNEVSVLLGTDAKSAKNMLALIIDRRNKIAHEADMDPSSPGARWPIDDLLVTEALDTIERIGNAIYRVANLN